MKRVWWEHFPMPVRYVASNAGGTLYVVFWVPVLVCAVTWWALEEKSAIARWIGERVAAAVGRTA